MIASHQPLARRLAHRYAYVGHQVEDLEQVALLGLTKAARRFDPAYGTAFSTFAVPTILGELRRYCRDTRWCAHVPRPVQERVRAVRRAEEELGARRVAPTTRALAQALGCTEEEVLDARFAACSLAPVSLDAPVGSDEDDEPVAEERLGSEDDGYLRTEERDRLERALERLSGASRLAVVLRLRDDLTVAQIARRLGVSNSQASKLLSGGLEELRRALSGDGPIAPRPALPGRSRRSVHAHDVSASSRRPPRRSSPSRSPLRPLGETRAAPQASVPLPRARTSAPCVSLASVEPELFQDLSPHELLRARRFALAPRMDLPTGAWDGCAGSGDPAPDVRLLVVEGFILRSVVLDSRARSEILGPGDVLQPGLIAAEATTGDRLRASWAVVAPATVAVLAPQVMQRLCEWPTVTSALLGRAIRRSLNLGLQIAIVDLRRIEDRLLHLFDRLGGQWGRVARDGIVIPIPLTHEMIAQLVGAHRPTVTTALRRLEVEGLLRRRPDRSWVLQPAAVTVGDEPSAGPAGADERRLPARLRAASGPRAS